VILDTPGSAGHPLALDARGRLASCAQDFSGERPVLRLTKFGLAASALLLLAGCASSTPYAEHQGAYTVVTAPLEADAQVKKSQKYGQQDTSENGKTAR
jgi:hypothetical protein